MYFICDRWVASDVNLHIAQFEELRVVNLENENLTLSNIDTT